jgi:CO/xanthine dehydrogenase FAD-binding subunit
VKPAPFAYEAPETLEEAVALLAVEGEEVRPLAGGQSLVPLLNFRLARPDRLVDLNGVGELAYLRRDGDVLRIGALARSGELVRSADAAASWPLLVEAARLVGHPQIRARGTVCGSVAHADPAAELPVALAAFDARFHVRSARGARTLSAGELFVSFFTTALEPDELLVEVEVPAPPPRTGGAFVEHARTHGDFALAGAAAVVTLDEAGRCAGARLALLAAGPTPVRALAAESLLVGSGLGPDAVEAAAEAAVRRLELSGGDVDWRRALLRELARQALAAAAWRAA